ncbi:uncharacterized protein PFL1_05728 [Pseudozyma flocculosa PF-1]|uniref:2-dehydropantoate 2-reductase n=2 Tax=Pseudozyma flocculosa TaxID=84751 RepID=A0A5C3FA13_9BASI|nr:uncharacterized protein PFL1_05728 [Pseudozyma flocculosa PF-1]EPQ26749.1 hypothetical protein PFL1_05728 [Pseudozyma flocculosa PF-1]SPO40926.1 uncharacterized protein PSFLO_06408 [Pseudozyma flocculosa]
MTAQTPPRSRPLHILVVGAGAVGCFYASRLHNPSNGVLVSLVCRSNYKTIAEKGVELETHSFGNYHFTPHRVFASIQEAADNKPESGTWDYVVVTTKALPDVTNDAHDIRPLVTRGIDGSCIVLIQNGVGVEEVHRDTFPDNPIVSAVTVISAEQGRHGFVRQNRWTRISMGCFTNGTGKKLGEQDQALLDRLTQVGDAKVKQLVSLFTDGAIKDAEFYDEVGLQLVRWHKICINGSMNPSAVLSGGTGNARMSLDPELRRHLHACMQEVFDAVPKVLGRRFPDKLASPEKILKSTERNTKGKPSMLLDWQANRPMELEVILGNPVKIARRHGVEMPRLQSLYALLKMAQARRDEDLREAKAKL